jgi:hypothetical protein
MAEILTFDDDPRREEKADLGDDLALSLISNTLRVVENRSSLISHAMSMQGKDHEDYREQQGKTARILLIAMTGGLLLVAANIMVISVVSGVATRIILGSASAAGLGLVYYLRSTLVALNRELQKERKTIRDESIALIDKEDPVVEELRNLLKEPERFRAIVITPQEKEITELGGR